jgi:flagellar protein FliO/FliZ
MKSFFLNPQRAASAALLVLALAPAAAVGAAAPSSDGAQRAATTTTPAASSSDAARARRYQEDRPLDVPEASSPDAGGSGGGLGRTIFGLAIVLAVIFGVHWVLKQLKGANGPRASGGGLASVSTLPLGRNRTLHLVRAGDDLVLVGVTEKTIVPVRSWSDEDAEALLELLPADGRGDDDGDGDGGTAPRRDLRWALAQLRQRTVRR